MFHEVTDGSEVAVGLVLLRETLLLGPFRDMRPRKRCGYLTVGYMLTSNFRFVRTSTPSRRSLNSFQVRFTLSSISLFLLEFIKFILTI